MFDAGKTRMIGLRTVKNYEDTLSRFHPIPGRYGQNCYINIARQCADAR